MIKAILLTWFILNFEPFQMWYDKQINRIKLKGVNLDYILYMPTCSMCLGFWLGLLFTFNFWIAIAVSLISYFIDLCLQKLNK